MQIKHATHPTTAPTGGTHVGHSHGPKATSLESDSVIAQPTVPTAAAGDAAAARPGRQDRVQLDSAVSTALAADANAKLGVDSRSNAATFLSGSFAVDSKPGVGGSGRDSLARTFLAQHGNLFGLSNQTEQLKLVSEEKDALGFNHYRYEQLQNGLPVFGQQLTVHAQGEKVTSVAGSITPNITGDATPQLAGEEAARRAMALTRNALQADGSAEDQLTAIGAQDLGWYTLEDGTPKLAYSVVVGGRADQRWQMYVDATSGDVLDKWATVHSAIKRETVDHLTGKVRREGAPATGDAALDAAHDNAGDVYDYFNTKFKRDSIDGKGMKLESVVHYEDPRYPGEPYVNAFWDGQKMTYGDGDGVEFLPFSLSADVVAHEMAHGVTERSANLVYSRQPGALNESWSDVFGNLVEKWGEERAGKAESDPQWRIGEAIFTPDVDGDGLRSMSKPGTGYAQDPQPGHMKNYVNTTEDNGGVHINSGIPNKAAYEIAMTIGNDKLGEVWYRALTTYLTPRSQFTDAANVTVQSAIDLYGANSAEAKAVAAGWTSVGLTPALSPAGK